MSEKERKRKKKEREKVVMHECVTWDNPSCMIITWQVAETRREEKNNFPVVLTQ